MSLIKKMLTSTVIVSAFAVSGFGSEDLVKKGEKNF